MNRTHCYEFWIANMFHYTVAVTDGAPVTVWFDDLDHRRPVLEWRAGEEQSRDVATATRSANGGRIAFPARVHPTKAAVVLRLARALALETGLSA
jgi:hypothetical protein